MTSSSVLVSIVDRFIEAILSTPAALAAGIHEVLTGVGLSSHEEKRHHKAHLIDFIDFIKEATFSDGIHHLSKTVLEESFKQFPAQTLHAIANRLAFTSGRAAAYSFLVDRISKNIVSASKIAETRAVTKSTIKSVIVIISVFSQISYSGAAADRLQRFSPDIYDLLKRKRLVGGFYLIESAVAPYLNMSSYLRDADSTVTQDVHNSILNRM